MVVYEVLLSDRQQPVLPNLIDRMEYRVFHP